MNAQIRPDLHAGISRDPSRRNYCSFAVRFFQIAVGKGMSDGRSDFVRMIEVGDAR
jgi:hypothetical protein